MGRLLTDIQTLSSDNELTDSLHYAGLIQSALLPSNEMLEKFLPEHFILFLPRDIVSGDFYWVTREHNKILVAVGDATGHGVPGAFMSIMGIFFLNEIINQHCQLTCNRILNRLREKVMKALHQTGTLDEARDGMDISLCIYDPANHILEFSGAFNSLYLVRKGKLSEYKADRMPIGVNAIEEKSFTNQVIRLEKGDSVYLFTDGFADQFGGPLGKKFKYGAFQQMIIEHSGKSMIHQKHAFYQSLRKWMAGEQQTDDILVVGMRFIE